MTVAIVILLVLLMLAVRVPVGFALAAGGVLGLYLTGGTSLIKGIIQSAPSSGAAYSLTPIPLFILMAHFVLASGVMKEIFDAARTLVGRVRGGTGVASTLSGAVFGAISGSSTASAATLAKTASTQLISEGYNPRIATGMIAISGTLAAMVPPSIILIYYAILAEQSVGMVLLSGFVPAILVTMATITTLGIIVVIRPESIPRGERYSFKDKVRSARAIVPVALLFGLVTGTVYFGVATPTEASALGAVGGLVIYVVRRGFNVSELRSAIVGATYSSVMILFIIVGAAILGYFITMSGITKDATDYVGSLQVSPVVVMLVIAAFYIVLGFFLEQMAILALTVPVMLPIVVELGYDPIWFGVFVVLLAEIGLVSPPLGLNVFVVARATQRDSAEVFKGTLPFIAAILVVVVVFILFPEIALWLPNSMSS